MNMQHLEHHGILGQKWGVRRYQKSDGTLTRKGRKRFKKTLKSKRLQEKTEKFAIKRLTKETAKYSKKQAKYEKRENVKKSDVYKKYAELSSKRLSDIKNGTMIAGRDYAMTCSKIKMPYVYITTGPKIGTFEIPSSKLVFKDSN